MKKQLLSMAAVLALFSTSFAQTTNYLDFEGALPTSGTFGGSDLSIVENPSKTGVNTSDHVAKTQKFDVEGTYWWGGAYFPCGGTVNFTPTEQTFSIDVYCAAAGEVMCKVEQGAQGAAEVKGNYTDAGQWQTVTFDMSTTAIGLLNGDYKQLVIFMGTGADGDPINTEVWYYDNVKGPGFTAGASVDPNVTITDYTGTAASVAIAFSSVPDTKIALDGAQGENSIWTKDITGVTGSTIFAPVTYTIYVTDADNWALQLEQLNFVLVNEREYIIKFDAWADAARIITLTIEDPQNGYAALGASDDDNSNEGRSNWNIELTTDQTEYELSMTVDAMQANSVTKFAFLLAISDEPVYIDNVSLKIVPLISVPSEQASSLAIYPNPATNVAYVNTQVGTLINVYSITGKLMMSKVAANEVESIDVANLATGIYMVKVAEKAVRLVVK